MMDENGNPKVSTKLAIWLPVGTALLALGLGLVLSEVQVKIGWQPLIAAILISLFIFYLAIHLYVKAIYPTSLALLEDLKGHIDRHTAKDYVTWAISSKQLARFEAKVKTDQIWLVTCDLSEDIPGEVFFDVVHANLKRGVHYRYFIPQSLQAEARAKSLTENHKGAGKLDIVVLSDDFFFLTEQLDIAIYDPLNKTGARCGYLGLPVPSPERIHAELLPEFVDLVIGRLQKQLPP
jgi:hypothetical protein